MTVKRIRLRHGTILLSPLELFEDSYPILRDTAILVLMVLSYQRLKQEELPNGVTSLMISI